MFLRILGASKAGPALCSGGANCPAILEMESGDYAIIGIDMTDDARGKLPSGSGCGPEERIVRIPRSVMVQAREDIPTMV